MNENKTYDRYHKSPVLSRKISPHIELRFENNQTDLSIDEEYVETCWDVKLNIPLKNVRDYDYINSIDDISDLVNNSDSKNEGYILSPEEKFWGHCSNIQAWVENDYDTRVLHSNIAFPLLKRLNIIGDSKAKKVFKKEIVERFLSGEKIVIIFLLENSYLDYLTEFEKKELIESVKINFTNFKIFEFTDFIDLLEEFYLEVGNYNRSSFLMNNLDQISNFFAQQLSEPNFDNKKIHILFESLNRLILFLFRYEKRIFDYGRAIYKIKKYWSNYANAEIRDNVSLYIKNKKYNYYTETNFSLRYERYRVFLDLKSALFGDELIIFSSVWINNLNNLIVDVILFNKKVTEIFNENFSNLSDWIDYKHSVINQLTDFEEIELEFIDKIHYLYLIIWHLVCRLPKQREIRFIKQSNFIFEITEYFSNKDCDVMIVIDDNPSIQNEFGYSPQNHQQRFHLTVKDHNEEFYRRYDGDVLYDLIKSLFFRDEKLIIDAIFWRKHHEVFEISVKFDSFE